MRSWVSVWWHNVRRGEEASQETAPLPLSFSLHRSLDCQSLTWSGQSYGGQTPFLFSAHFFFENLGISNVGMSNLALALVGGALAALVGLLGTLMSTLEASSTKISPMARALMPISFSFQKSTTIAKASLALDETSCSSSNSFAALSASLDFSKTVLLPLIAATMTSSASTLTSGSLIEALGFGGSGTSSASSISAAAASMSTSPKTSEGVGSFLTFLPFLLLRKRSGMAIMATWDEAARTTAPPCGAAPGMKPVASAAVANSVSRRRGMFDYMIA